MTDPLPRRRTRTHAHPLEPRRLLADVTFVGGTLSIAGTDNNDVIEVAPTKGDSSTVTATLDGDAIKTVKLSALKLINVSAKDGDDEITIDSDLNVRADLYGGDDRDTIHSGAGDDFLRGGKGDDTIFAGSGDDLVTGGAGTNHLYGEDGDDKEVGSSSHDYLYGGAGQDRLYGNLGDDHLDGGGGKDRLYGSSDHDTLLGGTGNDVLYGNSEADTLGGGRGRDRLVGGTGKGDDVAYADDEDILSQIEVRK